jgi:hypothetical protein
MNVTVPDAGVKMIAAPSDSCLSPRHARHRTGSPARPRPEAPASAGQPAGNASPVEDPQHWPQWIDVGTASRRPFDHDPDSAACISTGQHASVRTPGETAQRHRSTFGAPGSIRGRLFSSSTFLRSSRHARHASAVDVESRGAMKTGALAAPHNSALVGRPWSTCSGRCLDRRAQHQSGGQCIWVGAITFCAHPQLPVHHR